MNCAMKYEPKPAENPNTRRVESRKGKIRQMSFMKILDVWKQHSMQKGEMT